MDKGLIGKKIEGIIKREGLTQKEFAGKLGFSNTYISDIVRGQTKPSLELLQKMRYVFNVSVDWILSEEHIENTDFLSVKESVEAYDDEMVMGNKMLKDAEIDDLLKAIFFKFKLERQALLDKYIKNQENCMKGQSECLSEIKRLLVKLTEKK
jgi:transcriptional regulator with XRE-family HTH domain